MAPAITVDTPRANVKIQGIVFTVATPFTEGYALTAGEASQLNQVWCENTRNNFASTVDEVKEEYAKANGMKVEDVNHEHIDLPALQSQLDDRVSSYQMGVRRVGGSEANYSPEEREARKIARERVIEALKNKNIKLKSVSDEKMEEFVSKLSSRDDIVQEARRRMRASAKIASEALSLEDLAA